MHSTDAESPFDGKAFLVEDDEVLECECRPSRSCSCVDAMYLVSLTVKPPHSTQTSQTTRTIR